MKEKACVLQRNAKDKLSDYRRVLYIESFSLMRNQGYCSYFFFSLTVFKLL